MLENYIANEYVRFVLILLFTFLFGKIFTIFLEKILYKWISKTKTNLDDIIVKKTRSPLIFLIFLFGLKISLEELSNPIFNNEIVLKIFT